MKSFSCKLHRVIHQIRLSSRFPQEGQQLVSEKPELKPVVEKTLQDLQRQWLELEETTQTKAQCLFDANRAELFTQSCSALDVWLKNLEGQLQSDDYGKDLTSVNILLKKHQVRVASFPAGRMHLKGYCAIFRDFQEATATSRRLIFRLQRLSLSLHLDLSYCGLRSQTWKPHPAASSLVYLKTRAVSRITKHTVRQLDWPHQASLEIWWRKMAANWA